MIGHVVKQLSSLDCTKKFIDQIDSPHKILVAENNSWKNKVVEW